MEKRIESNQVKEKFLSLNLGKSTAIFTKPFKGIEEEILEFLKEKKPSKIVFLDTPPMQGSLKAISQIKEILPETEIIWRDHHDIKSPSTERDIEIANVASQIREQIGANAIIETRKEYPAISLLLKESEFDSNDTIIIADNDLDGFTGSLKACGIIYPELDSDAEIFDGPRSAQNGETLSEKAWLLSRAMSTLPSFNPKAPEISIRAKKELYQSFIDMINGDEKAKEQLLSKVNEYEKQVETAKKLLEKIETIGESTLLIDTTDSERYDLATIAEHMDKSTKISVIKKSEGPIASNHGGIQYSIVVSKKFQEGYDIREILPEGFTSDLKTGIIANTPFMIHISENVWNNGVKQKLEEK